MPRMHTPAGNVTEKDRRIVGVGTGKPLADEAKGFFFDAPVAGTEISEFENGLRLISGHCAET